MKFSFYHLLKPHCNEIISSEIKDVFYKGKLVRQLVFCLVVLGLALNAMNTAQCIIGTKRKLTGGRLLKRLNTGFVTFFVTLFFGFMVFKEFVSHKTYHLDQRAMANGVYSTKDYLDYIFSCLQMFVLALTSLSIWIYGIQIACGYL